MNKMESISEITDCPNGHKLPQIREQMSGPDLHVFTLKFLALKKTGFPP